MSSSATKTFYEIVKSAPKGRWNGIKRNYAVEDVEKLRGSVQIDYTLATTGANKLWNILRNEPYVNALGAVSGNQAMQMVRAGLKAIYLSGWQVAADANSAGSMYPDQSLYPSNSGPELVKRINKTLQRADQIEFSEGSVQRDWYAPIVADAEAGFGGPLNCFEIMKAYIEAGAAGVHYEDQLASEKKCGHLGGKVLIPSLAHIRNLNAARLAADVCGVPTVLVARTDAESAKLITSDIDETDREFIDFKSGRTAEGYFRLKENTGLAHCIKRGLSYAETADLLWWETSTPDLKMAKEFAEAVRKQYPDKLMAYNCSPSFNWEKHLSKDTIAKFQKEIGAMGYKFQFVTLAGFHALNYGMYDLALHYKEYGMAAYSDLQQAEFQAVKHGYTAVQHQREVGTSYFDQVATAAAGGHSSTTALDDSTEKAQFHEEKSSPTKPFDIPTPMKKDVPIGEPGSIKIGSKMPLPVFFQQAHRYHTTVGQRAAAKIVAHQENVASTLHQDETLFTPQATEFLVNLQRKFAGKRKNILEARLERQGRTDAGELPKFLNDTAEIRESDWQIKGTPSDLQDRRVEITGPVDRKMVINALNSGAKVYMADFEDSSTPTWRNLVEGQKNLFDYVRNQIDFVDPQSKKKYAVKSDPAVLMVRPRGWHLDEKHFYVDHEPMSGSLFDFGLFFFHNAKALIEKGTGPYYYLPKMESYREAALWDEVFRYAQNELKIPHGTIKATVLIEHIMAAFQCDEILHALKDHIVGLNCGRWDYIFSYVKMFRNHKKYLLPDRSDVNMTSPFMRAYSKYVVHTCHKRGAHAMGGMAANIPIKNDPKANETALGLVRADKEREVNNGHDGTWVAHPGLVPLATEVFNSLMKTPNQVHLKFPDGLTTAELLLACPVGLRTENGLRRIITVSVAYLEAWLRGVGCVPLFNLMEDAATAEISRTIIWHWVYHGARLNDGRTVNREMIERFVNEETKKLSESLLPNSPTLTEAAEMFLQEINSEKLADFLTLRAYDRIIAKGQ